MPRQRDAKGRFVGSGSSGPTTTYEPFDQERFNRELKAVMGPAMKRAAEEDRDQMISNIKSGVSPLGGPQKANAPETIRRKGSSTPLIGEKGTLIKPGAYRIVEINEPNVAGYALLPPASREAILVKLAGQGYPVFWLDDRQVWIGTAEITEALQRMSDSFRGAPR
jgi:hypothetical protein